jgi:hypothetical protein
VVPLTALVVGMAPGRGWGCSPHHCGCAGRCRRTMTADLCVTTGSGEDRGRDFVGLAQRGQVPARDDDGSTPSRVRASSCWNSIGKKRSSRPEMTVAAAGQLVKVQGSRKGRCDCSPFGVAVARTSAGTSWSR